MKLGSHEHLKSHTEKEIQIVCKYREHKLSLPLLSPYFLLGYIGLYYYITQFIYLLSFIILHPFLTCIHKYMCTHNVCFFFFLLR